MGKGMRNKRKRRNIPSANEHCLLDISIENISGEEALNRLETLLMNPKAVYLGSSFDEEDSYKNEIADIEKVAE